MELKDEFIVKDTGEVEGFNGSTSKPYGRIMQDIALYNKAILVDFYIMNYNAPHKGLFDRG